MIYVVTHKIIENESFIDRKFCEIIHVGDNKNYKEYYVKDNTGDNISHLNPNFCELTALYWIWKNAPEQSNDVVGIEHYRRFFTQNIDDFKYKYFNRMPKALSGDAINDILKKYEAIIPNESFAFSNVKEFYGKFHNIEDLEKSRNVLSTITPDYLDIYDNVMNSHHYIYGNMIICRRDLLNDYSQWLFNVLFELSKEIDIDSYENDYEKRVYGFIAERLLQVWLKKNNVKCKHMPVFNTEVKTANIFDENIIRIKEHLGIRNEK